MPPKALLIVEDDSAVHQLLEQAIALLFERPAFFAATGEEALDVWH